jgi:hypothetical protein
VATYAVARDFCRLFAEDMNGLYVLSLLLTADAAKAEQCFVSSLEDCLSASRVFKDWTRSWARRTIIQNAVRMMKPTAEYPGPWAALTTPGDGGETSGHIVPLAALLELKTFDRFVFVMSVLERYSDQDCKALLGGSRQDIVRARIRALKSVSTFKEGLAPNVISDSGRLFVQQRLVAKTA